MIRKATIAVILTTGLLATASLMAADWPEFLGANRDSVSAEKNLLQKWPEGGPPVRWTVEVGLGYGGAAIRDGQVYILDRKEDDADVLRCLDIKDGKDAWTFEYPAKGRIDHPGSRSTPTVDEENVYTVGSFGQVYCIGRQTHQPVWNVNLQEKYKAGHANWGFAQSPLLHGDHLIVSPLSAETPGLVALDKKSGKVVWESENFGGDFYTSPIARKVLGVEGIFQLTNNQCTFVNAATGKTLWKYNGWSCKWPIPAPTVLPDGHRVFITGGYGAGSVMIDVVKTGDKFETKELFKLKEGCQLHTPINYQGKLYANINENDNLGGGKRVNGGLACIDPDSGKIVWRSGADPNFERGALMFAGDLAIMIDGEKGLLYLISPNPDGYKEIAKAKLLDGKGKEVWAPMALSNGLLVIRDQTQMKCVDLRSEKRADAGR
jgi:outer membrane protein assembly factor BamB